MSPHSTWNESRLSYDSEWRAQRRAERDPRRQYRDPQDVCDRELADTLEAERAKWARKRGGGNDAA